MTTTKTQPKPVVTAPTVQFKPGPSMLGFLEGRAKVWDVTVGEATKRCAIIGGLGFDPRHHDLLAQLADRHHDRRQPFVSAAVDARRLIADFEMQELRRRGVKAFNLPVTQTRDVLRQMIKDIEAAEPGAAWSIGDLA